MPGNIKGITIEFSGDTTSLSSALKEIQREATATDKELRQINQGLKFNPSNVTLLANKQQVLKEKVQQTSDKLKALKQAQAKMDAAGVDKNSAQYRKLQTEIAQTESKLKTFKGQLAALNNVNLVALGEKFKAVGEKMSAVGKTLTTKVSAPIAAIGGIATKTAIDFDTQMSKVKALSGATGDEFDKLRDKAREMGSKTAFTAKEAGEGFEYMALAGWDTKDMLNGINPILDLAAASALDLGTTSDIVTDALTAFGLSAKDAAHFSDVLAQTQSKSNTTTQMLGEAFKYVGPVAGAMGYKVEDVSVALGLMANNGIKASQGGTSLRNIMQRMAAPTDKVAIAMEDLGLSLDDGNGNMKSFQEVMVDLRGAFKNVKIDQDQFKNSMSNLDQALADGVITEKQYDQQTQELAKSAFGAEGALKAEAASTLAGTKGMAGLLAIVSASDEDFNKLTQDINNADGATSEMASTMLDNAGGSITIMKSALSELGIVIGDMVSPYVKSFAEFVTGLAEKLSNMNPTLQGIIVGFLGFVAAIGPVLLIVGKIASGIGLLLGVISKIGGVIAMAGGAAHIFGAAMAAITGPIGIVVAAIAGLTAVFIGLYKNNESFRNSVNGLGKAIAQAFGAVLKSVIPALKTMFGALGSAIKSVVEAVAPLVQMIGAFLYPKLMLIVNVLKVIIPIVMKLVGGVLTAIINMVTVVAMLVGTLAKTLKSVFTGIASTVKSIWNSIKSAATSAWKGISSAVIDVARSIALKVKTTIQGIKSTLSSIWNSVKSTASKAWSGISDAITSPIKKAKDIIKGAIDKIKSIINGAKLSLPKFKLPHFKVSGGKLPWGLGGKGTPPKISVDWYAKGGIFNNASLIGVGEKGSEAVLPLDPFWDKLDKFGEALETNNQSIVFNVTVNGAQDPQAVVDEIFLSAKNKMRTLKG